jgi:hypothetical protein
VAEVVEHLPSKHEVLNSNSSITKKQNKTKTNQPNKKTAWSIDTLVSFLMLEEMLLVFNPLV